MKSKFLNFKTEYFNSNYLFSVPRGFKFQIPFLVFFILLIVFAVGFKIYVSKKLSDIPVYKKLSGWFFWGFLSFGLIGLFLLFMRYEQLSLFSYRGVFFFYLFCLLCWIIFIIFYYFKKVPPALLLHKEKKRKEKWLPKAKRK